MARIKGIGMVGIVKALRTRSEEARAKLPQRLHHYLVDRIVVAAWYPEQDYLELIMVFAAMWRIRDFEQIGIAAARESLQKVYRNMIDGGAEAAIERMRANWRNYHDTGQLHLERFPGKLQVTIADYGVVSAQLCQLNQGYIAEHLRLAGARVTWQRKLQCTANGDPRCTWEFEWTT